MLNVYACGCTATDVPVVSRCKTHGGLVIAMSQEHVPTDARLRRTIGNTTLLHCPATVGLDKFYSGTVDIIITYPEPNIFYALTQMRCDKISAFRPLYFKKAYNALSSDGFVYMIVDDFMIQPLMLLAYREKFKLVGVNTLHMPIVDYSFCATRRDTATKFGILFSKTGEGPVIPTLTLDNKTNILKHFPRFSGFVVDTSGIHYPIIKYSAKRYKTACIIPVRDRFLSVLHKVKAANFKQST